MRLESFYSSPSVDFRCEIIDVEKLDAAPLLSSPDWADNLLAIFAQGDLHQALDEKALQESGMIDLMDNYFYRPVILKAELSGKKQMLRSQLAAKFGVLPEWAEAHLEQATTEELDSLAIRLLKSDSLEDTLH